MKIIAKPLDWARHPQADYHRAMTPLGVYDVSGMVAPCRWRFAPHDGTVPVEREAKDVPEAMQEAAAHFESLLAEMIDRVEA